MTTVYWNLLTNIDGYSYDWAKLLHIEPEPVLKHILKDRNAHNNNGHYTKCPAFLDYYKNTYVIRSPVDITLTYNRETNYLSIAPQGQQFFESVVVHRGDISGVKDPFLMSLRFHYFFMSEKECLLEQLPITFHDDVVAKNIRVINGTFDISKWHRPIEFAFELLNSDVPLVIKRGDPLFYVRFLPKDSKKVALVKKEFSKERLDTILACVSVKKAHDKQPLSVLYKLAERLIHPKRCPFNWRNK